MSAYRRDFDKIFTKDNVLLEKENKIWKKVSNSIKKGFDNEPVYNEKYLKANKKLKWKNQYKCSQ